MSVYMCVVLCCERMNDERTNTHIHDYTRQIVILLHERCRVVHTTTTTIGWCRSEQRQQRTKETKRTTTTTKRDQMRPPAHRLFPLFPNALHLLTNGNYTRGLSLLLSLPLSLSCELMFSRVQSGGILINWTSTAFLTPEAKRRSRQTYEGNKEGGEKEEGRRTTTTSYKSKADSFLLSRSLPLFWC